MNPDIEWIDVSTLGHGQMVNAAKHRQTVNVWHDGRDIECTLVAWGVRSGSRRSKTRGQWARIEFQSGAKLSVRCEEVTHLAQWSTPVAA